jgi:hypothetical protein
MTRLCIRVHVHAYAGRWMRSGMVQAFCAGLQRYGFVFLEDGWCRARVDFEVMCDVGRRVGRFLNLA